MLERTTLARPYAKAIFEIAFATKNYEGWHELLKVLCFVVQDLRVIALLRDRTIPLQEVINFFLEICQKFLDESGRNFITILALHHRLEVLPEIMRLYKEMYAERTGMVEVEFVSPVMISEDEKTSFKKMLGKYLAKTVTMHCKVDKELLGGFLARAGNYVIDGSVRGYLANLKSSIGD